MKHLRGSAAVREGIGRENLEDKAKILAYSLKTPVKKKNNWGQISEITSN